MLYQQSDIEAYLEELYPAIQKGQYRIEMNEKRQRNRELFSMYVLSEKKVREILLSLTPRDFSEVLRNEHKGYEHERLYVFGKEVLLLERFGSEEKSVPLYIKLNKLENQFTIVISFHEQVYPIAYYFT